jgi:hypothetical protein
MPRTLYFRPPRFPRGQLVSTPSGICWRLARFNELEEALRGIPSGISDALNRLRTIKNPRLGTVLI